MSDVNDHNPMPEDKKETDKEVSDSLKLSASIGSLGLFFAFATIIGYLIGSWLDKIWETQPWLTLFFTLCGVAAGVLEFVKVLKKAKDESTQ